MSLPEKHFNETKEILEKIDVDKIAKWLLIEGYFPEQYVMPPPFKVDGFTLAKKPNYKVKAKGVKNQFNPVSYDLLNVSYPKSELTDKIFGIIAPKIYHDIVWYLLNDWAFILDHLFNEDIEIYSYSFPLPISRKEEDLTSLRIGRMIYEFVEMAENDLLAESHNYNYLVKCDIKNFYPSIYTHSISWALHGKIEARKDKTLFLKLGTILDKLFQQSNDSCTNGLPIGPAISDLIAEILLAAVDKDCSLKLKELDVPFLGVRYKDDYRFLCNTKIEGQKIIQVLQEIMRNYSLALNESKCEIRELPIGLFRPWKIDYHPFSLRYRKTVSYKEFEQTLLNVIRIDSIHKDTGVVDAFLSELSTKKYRLKLRVKNKKALKVFSLLLSLKSKRAKSFPHILAIIEQLFLQNKGNVEVIAEMAKSIKRLLEEKLLDAKANEYDLLWLIYFVKSTRIFKLKLPPMTGSVLLDSIGSDKQKFFTSDMHFYSAIKKKTHVTPLLKHLAVFKK